MVKLCVGEETRVNGEGRYGVGEVAEEEGGAFLLGEQDAQEMTRRQAWQGLGHRLRPNPQPLLPLC